MRSIRLESVVSQTHDLPLIIESIEGGKYIALTTQAEQQWPLSDDNGQWIKAHSLAHMRDMLAHHDWASVTLVQSTPYDEMIGHCAATNTKLSIPLHWSQPTQI